MTSKLTVLLILMAWVIVVVVPAINRWRSAQQVSSVARFRDQLHVLEKQCSATSINFSFTLTKKQEYAVVASPKNIPQSLHQISPLCYRRRRRTFSSLAGLSLASVIATAVLGTLGALSLVLSLVLLGSYVVLLRRSKLRAIATSRDLPAASNFRALEYS